MGQDVEAKGGKEEVRTAKSYTIDFGGRREAATDTGIASCHRGAIVDWINVRQNKVL